MLIRKKNTKYFSGEAYKIVLCKAYKHKNNDILENIAKLDLIKPKTKGILYKNLQKSGFILKYHYNELTEQQARKINDFLYNYKKWEIISHTQENDINKKSGKLFPTNLDKYNDFVQNQAKSGNLIPTLP